MSKRNFVLAALASLGLLIGPKAQAQLLSGGEGELIKGPLSASVELWYSEDPDGVRQRKKLVSRGAKKQPVVTVKLNDTKVGVLEGVASSCCGFWVQIVEMDLSNPHPEVLLASSAGGQAAYLISVLTSDSSGENWSEVKFGRRIFGSPKPARTFLGRKYLIDIYDHAFFFVFAPSAGRSAPRQFWELSGTEFVDVTRLPKYRFILESSAHSLEDEINQQNPRMSNGLFATYVATKALIGEFTDGWNTMIRAYEEKPWTAGLVHVLCPVDPSKERIECSTKDGRTLNSDPTALGFFLKRIGYINEKEYRQTLNSDNFF